jgi:hypothetical protein
LINVGSHGGNSGKNAHSSGNFLLADVRIIDEMEELIHRLVDKESKMELKLNNKNAQEKIYLHVVGSSSPCSYPEVADHIIDVQCSGAYEKIPADSLVPRGALHNE